MHRLILALVCAALIGCVPDETQTLHSTGLADRMRHENCVNACGSCVLESGSHPGMGLDPESYAACKARVRECKARCQ